MTKVLKSVAVDLGDRSYKIEIGNGLLGQAGDYIQEVSEATRLAIISDQTVADLHLDALLKGLDGRGYQIKTIVLPAGEAQKSFPILQDVLGQLLAFNLSRTDAIIAFGGGVIGDLSGFAASIVKRGCDFIQIPTTVLAQVDSSVGGKTAINVPAGKNLIGSFYQPKLVLTDLNVLDTLDDRQIKAGYAEALKYGLINDPVFFNWLDKNAAHVFAKDKDALAYIIAKSCQAKADIVRADEYEHGVRALLNLGHTFGHALEGIAGYDGSLLHGEAVSAGMLMAFEYANAYGSCPENDVDHVAAHLKRYGLTQFRDFARGHQGQKITADHLMDYMRRDKKNKNGDLTLILPSAIGKTKVDTHINQSHVHAYLDALCQTEILS